MSVYTDQAREVLRQLRELPEGTPVPVTVEIGSIRLYTDNHRGGEYQAATGVNQLQEALHRVSEEPEFNVHVATNCDYISGSNSRALRIDGTTTILFVRVLREREA